MSILSWLRWTPALARLGRFQFHAPTGERLPKQAFDLRIHASKVRGSAALDRRPQGGIDA
jgi:hypothetical protein